MILLWALLIILWINIILLVAFMTYVYTSMLRAKRIDELSYFSNVSMISS